MTSHSGQGLVRLLLQAVTAGARAALRTSTQARPTGARAPQERPEQRAAGYAGDYTGTPVLEYRPDPDGEADPGEVVWAWVPYEEDHSQGKDRPVLVLGREGRQLIALMLSSVDHDRDAAAEARHGRIWLDVGTGGWDRQQRPSEVRLDRVLALDPAGVRREGAALDRERFDEVAAAMRRLHGWR